MGSRVFGGARATQAAGILAVGRAMPDYGRIRAIVASMDLRLLLPFGVAAVAGVVCAVAPWWAPLGLLLGIGLLYATAIRPLVGLVFTFLLAFEAIPFSVAPDIPLGLFKLKPYELIFLWTIFAYGVRIALSKSTEKIEVPAFTMPMVFILLCVMVGVIYGKYFQNNGESVIAEARGFLGLLVAPMVQLIVRDRKEINRLAFWVSLVGIVLSMYIILQAGTGIRILSGRLESLDRHGNSDVMRSVVPGVAVQAFALYYLSISLWTGRRFRFWLIPFVLIVLLGLLATFGRGAWISVAFGGLIVAYLADRWRGLMIAMVLGIVLVGMTVSAAFVLKPRVAEAAIERALGIGKELTVGGSWGWRTRENDKALEVIKEHPLLGIGLGGAYKNLAAIGDPGFALEAYFIHNSYLYFPLKMGLVAGLGPLLIAGTFGLLLLRIYRETSGRVGPVVAVCTGIVAVILVGAYVSPTLKTFPGLLMLGTALALCATTYRLMHENPAGRSIASTREYSRAAL